MEYTDYYVVRGSAATLREQLIEVTDAAVIVDMLDVDFVPFATETSREDLGELDWLLRVYDAEGSAWGFELWTRERIGSGEFGANAEWGIDAKDNGFEGAITDMAAAVRADESEVQACLHPGGVDDFCELIGFPHQYMLYPRDLPDGVLFLSEF